MNKRNNGGITLIALIVTIIVLLILAGITINGIVSGDSTMNKAQETRNNANMQEVLEKVKLILMDCSNKLGDIDIDKLNTELQKIE